MSPINPMSEIRKKRALTQKITVLETIYSANHDYRAYLIEGTTGNQYDVAIRANPWCSCMDFELHKTRCKHIYYVLLKVLKAKNVDKETYTKEELIEMFTGKSPKPKHVPQYAKIEKLSKPIPQQATCIRLPLPVPVIPQPQIVTLPTMSTARILEPKLRKSMESLSTSVSVPVPDPVMSTSLPTYIEQTMIGPTETEQKNEIKVEEKEEPEQKINVEVIVNKNINLENLIIDPAEFKVEPEQVPTKLVFENTLTNKFKFMDIETDVFKTICGYIKEHYGPLSRDNAIKFYENNVSVDSIMKDDAFSGVYVTKVHDTLFELHIKTITKINSGWVFNKYTNEIKTEKIARFFTVNN